MFSVILFVLGNAVVSVKMCCYVVTAIFKIISALISFNFYNNG